eukprot:CAMPEP_0177202788 /NCGR_PEP_ID=MMETSP0367-20130122/27471_1 /TAXON_ID=447022 ORGANISM="Scrippsiella hangoei-like, Strain SHHI-4" /NCGR_SAMPLE_ID=MMETSP0367 /ASSEMBLY_ACC=CAM_ASM_000362 /LENGTH=103 /DNA_ID=CAMNT_0018651381 /DNA_START=920 /DNA_END=1231 /DNA_ORIENTATION=-
MAGLHNICWPVVRLVGNVSGHRPTCDDCIPILGIVHEMHMLLRPDDRTRRKARASEIVRIDAEGLCDQVPPVVLVAPPSIQLLQLHQSVVPELSVETQEFQHD